MSWRTVIISRRCKLDYRMGRMLVRANDVKQIVLSEIAFLVIENPAVSLTGSLLEALTENKTRVIFCDRKHDPVAELVPHHGSHDCTASIKAQIAWTKRNKGLAWQKIVCRKIRTEADLLEELGKTRECELLRGYIGQVLPHDPTNREGHAAKVYFNALFGPDFTRGSECPVNAALNYGYSILLSAFNREISANGCLTQLGIFHDNRFNHFNLSCDLMEPFRVLVDREVLKMKPEQFETEEKYALWRILEKQVRFAGSKQQVSAAIRLYTRRVLQCIGAGTTEDILFYEDL